MMFSNLIYSKLKSFVLDKKSFTVPMSKLTS